MSGQPEWRRAYLGLGSNLGERLENLRYAVDALASDPAVRLRDVSAVYETEPVGPVPQPDYLNAVAVVDTCLSPHALLEFCLRIEERRGRVRGERWGPRTLDVDILVVEGVVLHTERLVLPHPELRRRRFVLRPLADVAPDLIVEPFGKPVRELLENCPDDKAVQPYGPAELLQIARVGSYQLL